MNARICRKPLGVLWLLAAAAAFAEAPAAPERPAELPAPRSPEWGSQIDHGDVRGNAPLGVGHLRPDTSSSFSGNEWLAAALVPLYREPGGAPWGWLANGWLLTSAAAKRAFPGACLVETSYEATSSIVIEWRDDGWLRLAVDPPCTDATEPFWTHRKLLSLGEQRLKAELWQDFFFRDDVSPLSFRRSELPHALRVDPRRDAERITWIAGNHALEPLAVEGDWMRVRASQPGSYCVPEEEWQGRRDEGWIRWRDPVQGPWVYIWSRGC